ncbi:TPA: hypothetical protein QIM56_003165 [Morganella morganii subsp. morganii]|nr:hypothetical protein [Morganella morganii subsp. morganii]
MVYRVTNQGVGVAACRYHY